MTNNWISLLGHDDNYNCYVKDCPSWKMRLTESLDTAFRAFMGISICGFIGILATGHWITGLMMFAGGLIFGLCLWFRQLIYFNIVENYETSSWGDDGS